MSRQALSGATWGKESGYSVGCVPSCFDSAPATDPMPFLQPGLRSAAIGLALLFGAFRASAADPRPSVVADFTMPDHRWHANGSIGGLDGGADGLSMICRGEDPYLVGPVVDVSLPSGARKLLLELEGSAGGDIRCYAAAEGKDFAEVGAVNLVADGTGRFRGVIPALGERIRFRLDPPDGAAPVRLRRLVAIPLIPLAPAAPAGTPAPIAIPDDALIVKQGAVSVAHDPRRWNALSISIGGRRMADSNPTEVFFGRREDQGIPVDPGAGSVESRVTSEGIEIVASVREAGAGADAATWRLTRKISAAECGVNIETSVEVDRPRELIHLPWLTLFAGRGTFGTGKSQALLPGVEYLDDEPSSNEKEIRGPAAQRQLVDPAKVCFPSMVLVADGRWLAVDWEVGAVPVSPLFDSPDRMFDSGGHVLGLWSPAAGAFEPLPARFEGERDVYRGVMLEPGKPMRQIATIRGGSGDTVLAAVAERVQIGGLPSLPVIDAAGGNDGGLEAACRLLAHGWLDSSARDGTTWRHAVWQGRFDAQPAADAPACMLWLAAHVGDAALAARLRATAREALESLPVGATGGIGHLVRPALPLLLRPAVADDAAVGEALTAAAARARKIAAKLTAEGGRDRYVAGPTDYAATLNADHCNGFTALRAEAMLEGAVLGGDEAAIGAALAALDAVTVAHPAGAVPRGAQPWEMPLHTPDILASARLMRMHLLGHLLDGNPARLKEAQLWAWSGVPFVYLHDPLPGPVGRYATIGVLGATDWVAPLWIGQPVQWCGLVYAGALHDLARVSPEASEPWGTLARGITRTGLQMTFPIDDAADRGGLLPDYWLFGSGRGDGPAINPATVQATLAEAFEATPLVTATRITRSPSDAAGHVLHLPGEVRRATSTAATTTVEVTLWPEEPCRLILTRVARLPHAVVWNGVPIEARLLPTDCLTVTVPKQAGPGRTGTLVIEW